MWGRGSWSKGDAVCKETPKGKRETCIAEGGYVFVSRAMISAERGVGLNEGAAGRERSPPGKCNVAETSVSKLELVTSIHVHVSVPYPPPYWEVHLENYIRVAGNQSPSVRKTFYPSYVTIMNT